MNSRSLDYVEQNLGPVPPEAVARQRRAEFLESYLLEVNRFNGSAPLDPADEQRAIAASPPVPLVPVSV